MGTSPCSDSIVPIKMQLQWLLLDPERQIPKSLRCNTNAPSAVLLRGKATPWQNATRKPCWLPVGWWFKLSTYLSNVSGFD